MSKELTDKWRSKMLEEGFYFCLKENEIIEPLQYLYTLGFCGPIKEVLSPCDYNTLVHLETKAEWQAERVKELEQDVKTLTNNYKLLEKQQAENLAHRQALVDEFGDFEALYEELKNLRSLVKECKNIVAHDCWQEAQFPGGQVVERQDFLTRLNAAIGESEEK